MQITILGKGAFGQAIGSLLAYNNTPFSYGSITVPIDKSVDLLFITVPTQFIRPALQANLPHLTSKTIVVNCAKGVETDTLLLPYHIISQLLHPAAYYNVIGPSFAAEVATQTPTLVNLGYTHQDHITHLTSLLQTPYFRLQATPDYAALELSAALKNVYAISCGFAAGLGYKMNTRAQLITLALQEFSILAASMNLHHHGLAQPGLAGDLVLTCSSTESRNFSFGYYLASLPADQALAKVGSTVEGFATSISIQALSQKYAVTLPLANLTYNLIQGQSQASIAFAHFLAQPTSYA